VESDLGECTTRNRRTSPMTGGRLGPKLTKGHLLQCGTGHTAGVFSSLVRHATASFILEWAGPAGRRANERLKQTAPQKLQGRHPPAGFRYQPAEPASWRGAAA
jgi:hypothetical protein